MKALPAIYEGGRVTFPFHYPDFEGPVHIMVIFPSEEEDLEELGEELADDDDDGYATIPR